MKIEFLTENIEKFLPMLVKIVPSHAQVPVLSHLLLETDGAHFYISATDLEIGMKVKIPAKIEEEGAITVSGKHFAEVISSLSKGKVKLETEQENVVLSSSDGKMVFQTIPKEEFPELFAEKGEKIRTFTQKEIKDIFARLPFAASIDESRPQLTGVYINQKDDHTDFVATDGFRLSLKRIKEKGMLDEDKGLILSAKLMNEVLSLKEEQVEMYVYEAGNQVLFETPNVIVIGRLIHGDFPQYERVIPEENKTKVTVAKDEFAQALRLSSVFAKESANIVKLVISGGKILFLTRSSGIGEGEITVDAKQEGEDNEISFNVKYLNDLLRNVDAKQITMEINSPLESALFKVDNDPDFLHVIMPVRVQE